MGRPRESRNLPVKKVTLLRFERWKRGLSLRAVCLLTQIRIEALSAFERGTKIPSDDNLAALGRVYGYADSASLLHEVVIAGRDGMPT